MISAVYRRRKARNQMKQKQSMLVSRQANETPIRELLIELHNHYTNMVALENSGLFKKKSTAPMDMFNFVNCKTLK